MKSVNGELKITAEWLRTNGACNSAVNRYRTLLDDGVSLSECINGLNRADWLLWLLWNAKVVSLRQLVKLACVVGRMALRRAPARWDHPRLVYEAAEAWIAHPTKSTAITARRVAIRASRAAEAAARTANVMLAAAEAAETAAWATRASTVAIEAAVRAAARTAKAAGAAVDTTWAIMALSTTVTFKVAAEHKKLCDAIRRELKKPDFNALAK